MTTSGEADWARPVVFFEVRAKDAKRIRAFYREMFNWDIEENDFYARIPPGIGGPVEGVGGGIAPNSATPGVSIYVQVRNLHEALEKAERLGGRKTADPFDVPGGPTIAQIADPEGNLVGLIQQ
jgi:predicted enzyme related to lactoylglutathione lyase